MTETATLAYLDHNASSPLRPEARAALLAALETVGNPSSPHAAGRAARRALEAARRRVAAAVGVDPGTVIFTSGATEANALALSGGATRWRCLVSAIEHPAVLEAAPEATRSPVGADGMIDLAALERRLAAARAVVPDDGAPLLLSVMAVNNETGVIQPLAAVARLARCYGALLHCDAAQALGRIDLTAQAPLLDLISLSAHKAGGPAGIGALIVRDGLPPLAPLLRGGGQERGRRAGTENVLGAVGFAAAAAGAVQDLNNGAMTRLRQLRDDLEARLRRARPDLVIPGATAPRVANTSCLAIPGVSAETLVMALDLAGVSVGAGAACSSGRSRPGVTLTAMGYGVALARSAIRVSLGWSSTASDVARFEAAWLAFVGACGPAPRERS